MDGDFFIGVAQQALWILALASAPILIPALVAGLILGISESIVLTFFGASWAPAVAFGLLLIVLGVRPQGLFGR